MIKERLEKLINNPAIQHKEILWAINFAKEQAERADELEKEVSKLHKSNVKRINKMRDLNQKSFRYREALEFYADEDKYEFETIVTDCEIDVESIIIDDGGEKARQALEGESSEKN